MGTAIIIGILAIIVVIAVISSVKHMKGEGGCRHIQCLLAV